MSKTPFGITLTRILLLVEGLLLLASVLLLWLGSISALASRVILRLPLPEFYGPSLLPVTVLVLLGCCWLWITAAFILKRKSWARVSMLAIGLCSLAFGTWLVGGTSLPSLGFVSISHHLRLLYLLLIALYTGIALLGLVWLVYFSLPATRALFAPSIAPEYPAR